MESYTGNVELIYYKFLHELKIEVHSCNYNDYFYVYSRRHAIMEMVDLLNRIQCNGVNSTEEQTTDKWA